MCISPVIVPNPNYVPISQLEQYQKHNKYWFLKDITNTSMKVPCGLCVECLQARQNEFVQRCYELAKFNYVIFGTLTYSDECLPRINVNGRSLKYADIRDFQNFIKRVRKYQVIPDFRYLCVTEYGEEKHRPHFHFLIFVPYQYLNGKPDEFKGFSYVERLLNFITFCRGWYRNYGTNSEPLYIPLSRFIRHWNSYTYDCQLVTGKDSTDNVSFYVTKYVLKFSDYVNRLQSALRLNLSEEDYYKYWALFRPKLLTSKGLGLSFFKDSGFCKDEIDWKIDDDIRDNIEFSSMSEIQPMLYIDNVAVPLCQYYKKRCLTIEQRIKFHNNEFEAGPFEDESRIEEASLDDWQSKQQKQIGKQQKFEKVKSQLLQNQY